ncbi:MAG: ExeA family protein, partial [Planctomycetota bacterium]
MYCDFFGLRCPPFDDVPDPRFFFPSADHEEALALLRFAATNRKGPVLLTGGLGTGKTLLCRTLLSRVHIECIPVVCTCTPGDPNGLIRRVCKALNLRLVRSGVPVEEADRLKKHLSSRTTAQRSVVLLVLDQVENLTAADFEELVILSNLEAHGRRLVQILLVGQPRVTETLAAPQFEQLRQRMFALHNLRLLSAEEVVQYVRHRLNVVGRSDEALFDDDALALIAERSGGVPRLINQICDAALLAAYSTERKTIDRSVVAEVNVPTTSLLATASAEVTTAAGATTSASPEGTARVADRIEQMLSAGETLAERLERSLQRAESVAATATMDASVASAETAVQSTADQLSELLATAPEALAAA